MIIAGATIGAVSFGIQAYNAWRNEKNAKAIQEKQEAYQRAVMEKNFEVAMEQFHAMADARRQIIEEERIERKNVMQEMHKQNLQTIAELASLEKWPLAVMPLVMRDDNLFGYETDDVESIVPINVIMGPCRDRNFQNKIWKVVEDELSIRFAKSWNKASSHPVLFYQDAWKDDKDPADSAQCANIHASTQNVPTIIFSPVLTKRGLQIEMTHWCVTGMDASNSYCREIRLSLEGTHYQYHQNDDYENVDIEQLVSELVDMLEGIIGYMDDQYMWCRYSVIPLLPQLLSMRYDVDHATVQNMYEQYVAMLKSSLSNSQVQLILDFDAVLSYCAVIDRFGESDDAFKVVCCQFLGENALVDQKMGLPPYELDKLVTFLRYVMSHQKELSVSEGFISGLHYSISLESLYRNSIENLYTDNSINSCDEAHTFIMAEPITDKAKHSLSTECLDICDNLIGRCRQETDETTDRRNWVRPMFKEQVFGVFDQKATDILGVIDNKGNQYREETIASVLNKTLSAHQENDLLRFDSEEKAHAFDECYMRLKDYVKSKANDVKVDFWKDSYIKDSVEKRILEYCNASLVKWIDYIFFKEDIIHDSISDEDKQFIESKMVNLTQMLDKIADDYMIISFSPQTK